MNIVIDISSVVWNNEYFEQNNAPYYQLADEVMEFIDSLKKIDAKFLMRQELLDEIILSFPFELTSNTSHFKEFRTVFYKFLTKISDVIDYETTVHSELVTIPNILHPHFSEPITVEYKYLIREMHTTANHIVFCTFSAIWASDKLKTKCKNKEKEHDTIIHPIENINTYINSFKKHFDHNPKHDRNKGKRIENGEWVHPLSCFDGIDKSVPQELLNKAIQCENDFYSYDKENKTFVCFKNHLNNLYHGYDEEINNVPQEIRRKFINE